MLILFWIKHYFASLGFQQPYNPLQMTQVYRETNEIYLNCPFDSNNEKLYKPSMILNSLENPFLGKVCVPEKERYKHKKGIELDVEEMRLVMNVYACDASIFYRELKRAGCIKIEKDKSNRKKYKRKNLKLKKHISDLIIQQDVVYKNLTSLVQNVKTKQRNTGLFGEPLEDLSGKKCDNIKIKINLGKKGTRMLKKVLKVASIINEKDANGNHLLMKWKNLNKINLNQFICPSNEVAAVITEITRYLKIRRNIHMLKKCNKTYQPTNENLENNIRLKEASLDFMIGYIDLLDNCLVCIQNLFVCSFKKTTDKNKPKFDVCLNIDEYYHNQKTYQPYRYYDFNNLREKRTGLYLGSTQEFSLQDKNYNQTLNTDYIDSNIQQIINTIQNANVIEKCDKNYDGQAQETYTKNVGDTSEPLRMRKSVAAVNRSHVIMNSYTFLWNILIAICIFNSMFIR